MQYLRPFRLIPIGILALGLVSLFSLSACNKAPQDTTSQNTTTIHIGYQKYGLLPVVKARGELDKKLEAKGINIKWVEFPAGPQLLEGLNVGSVVLGEAGEAPPIFAQAANANLVYIANQPAAPLAEAIIIPKNSTIQSVSELKGKRIALNKGSNVHYLLLKTLAANQLSLQDIQAVYLPPADARAAFEKGAVDAWAIWDPFLAAAEKQLGAKVLVTGKNLVSNHQFYLADRQFAQTNPEILTAIVTELNNTTKWVANNQTQAAQLLAKPTGLPLDILHRSIARMGFNVKPLSAAVIQEQQVIADTFYQQKLIPKKINIKDALLSTP